MDAFIEVPQKERASTIETTTQICEIITEAAQRNSSHLVICGDFNYPGIDWECEYVDEISNIRPFLDTIQDCHLSQHIFQPTRYRNEDTLGLLDLVFTNEEGMIQNLTHNAGLGESDHECIIFTLNCYEEGTDTTTTYNYFRADCVTIRERLSQVHWVTKVRGNFLNAYLSFLKVLETAMDSCIPRYKNVKSKKNIYMTPEAILKKDLKNRLWRRYKGSGCDYDRSIYTKVKNELRSLTRKL